ncbi:hypothetical protein ASPZODRAFT_126693 [Penicilliopsis zonata CBS 506.65]|uniref:Uncharacterized protein n=1 Tax=Penicilliopsis zonata CBS 506.65 TaxID=1073090 RepID=A0A1L9SU87_9EURO|nr:hypothetical protein ASPZODRAFT_126693 [Penicilliopsis zonata CBS 506.65]OJJ50762.1 hypothetical protein ASPZODRAFT_126693 [Penicilliopsis zonata CBS 506.65]
MAPRKFRGPKPGAAAVTRPRKAIQEQSQAFEAVKTRRWRQRRSEAERCIENARTGDRLAVYYAQKSIRAKPSFQALSPEKQQAALFEAKKEVMDRRDKGQRSEAMVRRNIEVLEIIKKAQAEVEARRTASQPS